MTAKKLMLLTAPAMVAGISGLPAHLVSQGTAVRSLLGQVSGALSVAVLGAIIAARAGTTTSAERQQSAYNLAFLVAAVGVGVALLLAARLPRRLSTSEHAPVAAAAIE